MTKVCKDFIVNEYNFVSKFKCLTSKCPDTCCKNWDMQLDINTKALYDTVYPELEEMVTIKDGHFILKRDCESDSCTKLNKGKCSIHKDYGAEALGDACYFYPKVIHKIQENFISSATTSCPEIARITLFDDDAFEQNIEFYERIPLGLKNHFDGVNDYRYCMKLNQFFINLLKKESNANFLLKTIKTSEQLDSIRRKEWYDTLLAINQIGLSSITDSEFNKYDPLRIVQAFLVIIKSTKKSPHAHLLTGFGYIEELLQCKIDVNTTNIECSDEQYNGKIDNNLNSKQINFAEKILKRWLMSQLVTTFFPFAGLGKTLEHKTRFLVIKYLVNKIMIYAVLNKHSDVENAQKEIINVVYNVARYLDHLENLDLFKAIMDDYSWNNNHIIGMVKNI